MARFTIAGVAGARIVDTQVNFNLDSGYEEIYTIHGTKAGIASVFTQASNQGFTCTKRRKQGPVWECVVQIGGDYVADQWERVIEWAQIDIRNSKRLIDLASGDETLALWISEIEEALANRTTIPNEPAEQAQLRRLISRGNEAFEIRRYVLRLRRSFPASSLTKADPANVTEKFFSTPALIREFNLPKPIIDILAPATPSETLPETAWGWRLRTDDVGVNSSKGMIAEVREWVFAAWSTLLYEYIDA